MIRGGLGVLVALLHIFSHLFVLVLPILGGVVRVVTPLPLGRRGLVVAIALRFFQLTVGELLVLNDRRLIGLARAKTFLDALLDLGLVVEVLNATKDGDQAPRTENQEDHSHHEGENAPAQAEAAEQPAPEGANVVGTAVVAVAVAVVAVVAVAVAVVAVAVAVVADQAVKHDLLTTSSLRGLHDHELLEQAGGGGGGGGGGAGHSFFLLS